MDPQEIESALERIAKEAEDLSARLYESFPRQSAVFRKFANYCRHSGNCLRVYGSLPESGKGPPLVRAAKALTFLQREVSRLNDLWPTKD